MGNTRIRDGSFHLIQRLTFNQALDKHDVPRPRDRYHLIVHMKSLMKL